MPDQHTSVAHLIGVVVQILSRERNLDDEVEELRQVHTLHPQVVPAHLIFEKVAPDAAEDDYGPEAWRQVADTAARHPNSPDELTLTHFLGAGVGDNWTEERRRLAADLLREGWAGTTQELIEVVEAT